ncbi:hypothetical protein CYY_004010 [Polysphondylium violaceum]|uniref:Uncharacterized protein n=1 Tax=Polysphondylium violaceum TaxID=133409 RepID=A0A8J4Q649_9MYCE|nr:hypothetical protein CYY_004010 [Polysphondylium violaceum]
MYIKPSLYILSTLLLIASICLTATNGSVVLFRTLNYQDFKLCPVLEGDIVKIDTDIYAIPESFAPYMESKIESINGANETVYTLNRASAPPGMTLYVDIYIETIINETKPIARGYDMGCAKNLATYLCSYNFIKLNLQPCNDMCSTFESCPKVLNMTVDNQVKNVVPTAESCFAGGIKETAPGSCSTYPLSAGIPGWENIYPSNSTSENSDDEKYPGGKTKGTILGFGILIALLLMILGLGFIMRFQTKK